MRPLLPAWKGTDWDLLLLMVSEREEQSKVMCLYKETEVAGIAVNHYRVDVTSLNISKCIKTLFWPNQSWLLWEQ